MSEAIVCGTCPDCGSELVVRVNRQSNSEFAGCTSYPQCRYTASVPESVRLRRLGVPQLPGMERL